MLYAKLPWDTSNISNYMTGIFTNGVRFNIKVKISNASINFMRNCLMISLSERLTWSKIFEHEIFSRREEIYQNSVQYY